MHRNAIATLVIGLFVGLIIGYYLGSSRTPGPAAAAVALPAPSPSPAVGAQPMMGLPDVAGSVNTQEAQRRILNTQLALAENPKNLQAWVSLGNDYFDTHQAQKAVDAYAKALELDPSNPDVLTDQGVMYRELKAYDKAVANFERANKLQPRHTQSLFNLGIVYADDLDAPEKAARAFQRVIDADPSSPQAERARKALVDLKAHRHVN